MGIEDVDRDFASVSVDNFGVVLLVAKLHKIAVVRAFGGMIVNVSRWSRRCGGRGRTGSWRTLTPGEERGREQGQTARKH
jgi:hypothetical protein